MIKFSAKVISYNCRKSHNIGFLALGLLVPQNKSFYSIAFISQTFFEEILRQLILSDGKTQQLIDNFHNLI